MEAHFPDDPYGNFLKVHFVSRNLGRKSFDVYKIPGDIKQPLPQCGDIIFKGVMASSDFFCELSKHNIFH